jgi:hypothetical protein
MKPDVPFLIRRAHLLMGTKVDVSTVSRWERGLSKATGIDPI